MCSDSSTVRKRVKRVGETESPDELSGRNRTFVEVCRLVIVWLKHAFSPNLAVAIKFVCLLCLAEREILTCKESLLLLLLLLLLGKRARSQQRGNRCQSDHGPNKKYHCTSALRHPTILITSTTTSSRSRSSSDKHAPWSKIVERDGESAAIPMKEPARLPRSAQVAAKMRTKWNFGRAKTHAPTAVGDCSTTVR